MSKTDFPTSGIFTPKTDYLDRPPLNTKERGDLQSNTSKALDELNKNL
jgi:hypothetical protein